MEEKESEGGDLR